MLSSCDKKEDLVQDDSYFKTVDLHKALDFINQTEQAQKRSATQTYITSVVPEVNYEAITNSNQQLAVIPVTTVHGFLNSRLALLEIKGEVQSAVVSLNPFEHSTDTRFSGEILITDINGNLLKAFKLENNVIISEYTDNTAQGSERSSILKRNSANETDGSCACLFTVCDWCSLDEVFIEYKPPSPPTPYVSIAYMYPGGGGGGPSSCEVGCDGNNWNFGSGASLPVLPCANGYVRDAYGNCVAVKVINNLTNPCAKTIFSQLEIEMIKKDLLQKIMKPTQNVNLTFAESILKLFNDSNTFNLSIANGYLEDANGSTSGASITISDSYLKNATQLSIARTMIHETVHAYLNVKYHNFIALDDWDFKTLMEKYAMDNGIANINSNEFHHEFMGQYVDAMAASLLIWDEKYGTGGIKTKDSTGNDVLDWEYYRSMAFGGLNYEDSAGNQIETDSFKALVPYKSDRDKIKNLLINEQNGNSKSKGTKCK